MNRTFTPSVALLRPPAANEAAIALHRKASAHGDVELFKPLLLDESEVAMHNELRKAIRVREMIESTAEQLETRINLFEVQLRSRSQRHLQSNDLEHHHTEIDAAHVVAITDPSYNQVKYFRNHLRRNPIVRLILFYSERDRIDDYIADFEGQSRLAIFEDQQEGLEVKRATRIFPARIGWKKEVEHAVGNATDFKGLEIFN